MVTIETLVVKLHVLIYQNDLDVIFEILQP
jgi:hypothetical protein